MSAVHLHLLLNHVPVIGMVVVLTLLAAAAWRRSSELAKASLGLTVALAAVAVGVYLTGEPAEEAVERLPGFSHALVERHEDAALVAVLVLGGAGLASVLALVGYRRRPLPRLAMTLGLAYVVATTALLGWTAATGGQIRHTEIRTASASAAAAGDEGGRQHGSEEARPTTER